jgi:hypothetical protein
MTLLGRLPSVGNPLYKCTILTILAHFDPYFSSWISGRYLIMEFVADHLTALVVKLYDAATIEILQPTLELDEFDIPVIVCDTNPNLKMEDVSMGMP